MENQAEFYSGNNTEINEFLLFVINDILILSKEIEWLSDGIKKDDTKVISITVKGKSYSFCELSNYFYERDFLDIPYDYVNKLYKLLLELRVLGKKIESLSDKDKISILDFVLEMIASREKKIGEDFSFPQNYKDMIMIELGLDIVDKVGDATNETLALLEVIMMKR
ncbi:MAG: hypothetical protein PHI37_01495 [Candidatus Gracilibacteria bacterium]|nr:hypothetical protein [Candidatus Gracilibacteria bacterium]